jgi:putrescine---pyruvate transaminase
MQMSDSTFMPQRDDAQWQALDAAHHLHPFTDHAALGRSGTRLIARGEGVYLYEADGRQLLDGMSGLWCVNLGYGRRELADAAYRQLLELPYYNSFFQVTHPPAIELARLLAQVAPRSGTPEGEFKRTFFTCSGSDANDTALRCVRHYWEVLGQPQRQVVISRRNAYHGSTIAAASLGGMAAMHAQGGLPIPDIVHIAQPYWFGEGRHQSAAEFGLATARALEAKILELGPQRVAAFFAEPIQGAGGIIIPPASYWPEIQRIVDQYGLLLVADEVICGFGRTGEWFGSQYFGIRPHLMTLAKGITSGYVPLGAVLLSERVAEPLVHAGGEFHHGFTYSGHPVACAVACASIGILRNEHIVERVREQTGPYLQRRWAELAAHPLVAEARGTGLLAAIELAHEGRAFPEPGRVGTLCRDLCTRNGLVMRAVRDTMIVAPPLIISTSQIDELIDKARGALDATLDALTRAGEL